MTSSAVAAATTPGDHHDWPAAWATDALHRAAANHVYPSSLKNGRIKLDTHGGAVSVLAIIVAPTKNAYTANHIADARAQLLKAAIRLAALLNAIVWP